MYNPHAFLFIDNCDKAWNIHSCPPAQLAVLVTLGAKPLGSGPAVDRRAVGSHTRPGEQPQPAAHTAGSKHKLGGRQEVPASAGMGRMILRSMETQEYDVHVVCGIRWRCGVCVSGMCVVRTLWKHAPCA